MRSTKDQGLLFVNICIPDIISRLMQDSAVTYSWNIKIATDRICFLFIIASSCREFLFVFSSVKSSQTVLKHGYLHNYIYRYFLKHIWGLRFKSINDYSFSPTQIIKYTMDETYSTHGFMFILKWDRLADPEEGLCSVEEEIMLAFSFDQNSKYYAHMAWGLNVIELIGITFVFVISKCTAQTLG